MKGREYDLVKVVDCLAREVVDQLVFYQSVSLYLMGINENIVIPSYANQHYFLLDSQQQKSIFRYQPGLLYLQGKDVKLPQDYEILKYTVYSELDKQHTIKGQVRIYSVEEK